MSSDLHRVIIDYAEVGLARRFVVPVTTQERTGLTIGSTVLVIGDSVPPVEAKVRGWRGASNVELELL